MNDVRLTSDYWDETTVFNLPRQTSSVTYLQLLFGIRVKVLGPISMGWNIRYKARLYESKATYGKPWYIPGFGARNGALTGSFSVIYTIPIKKKGAVAIPEAETGTDLPVKQDSEPVGDADRAQDTGLPQDAETISVKP